MGWAILVASSGVRADEGMWTFDNLPLRQLKERYGFEPTPDGSPGSARRPCGSTAAARARSSRPTGLVMTNHHVAADTLQKISSPAKDYYKDGFLAARARTK